MNVLLQLIGISKSYGVDAVISDIHLQVNEGEKLGLVGINGAGKSTLLKIIAGEMSHDEGHIIKAKDMKIGYLAQNSGLSSERSIWNEMLSVFANLRTMEVELRQMEQSMSSPEVLTNEKKYNDLMEKYSVLSHTFGEQGGYEYEAKIRTILHGLGFGEMSPDTLIGTLSGGQKTRLALAKLLLTDPDLLMLDEPTNYLDIPTVTWLESYLQHFRGALLVVSHDRYFLDKLVSGIYEIERLRAKRYTGNYSRFMELKAQEYEIQMKHYEKQQGEIARTQDFIQRNLVRASTTKRAQSRRKVLERMERIDKPLGDLKKAHFSFEINRQSGRDVLYANELSGGYEADRALFERVTFDLKRGERVALIGPNGIGKSTLLKILTGQLEPLSGELKWGAQVKHGYYDQEQQNLHLEKTVLDEVWDVYPHLEEVKIRSVLGNFLFSGEDVLKKVKSLSGGEKARVSLAKLMLLNSNMLIMDEPTNHLDIYSKETLEAALDDFDGTLLFISHDRYFLNRMADRIIELGPHGVEQVLGNYDDYVEKKKEKEERAQFAAAEAIKSRSSKSEAGTVNAGVLDSSDPSGKLQFELEKQQKKDERARQRQMEQLEQKLFELEAEITRLEGEIATPKVYTDYKLLREKNDALQALKSELESTYAEWESLVEE
jgi:ATP-binding cassette subfamily F protein 3